MKLLLPFCFGATLLMLAACHRELSCENCPPLNTVTDTLPADYDFANGYCEDGLGLGINPQPDDSARFSFTDILPDSLQLDMPVPGDQKGEGSCSAWATVYAAGSYYFHIAAGLAYSDSSLLSPAYTYNQIVKGTCSCTSIRDHLYLLQTQGACSLKDMAYNGNECLTQPDSLQKKKAAQFKIKQWYSVDLNNLTLIKQQLLHKMPVIFSAHVDQGYKRPPEPYLLTRRTSNSPLPHAMLVSGYNNRKKAFRIMNSWGTRWADKGFVWVDYDYFLSNFYDPKGYVIAY